jgi:hypothetical protein
MILPYVSPRKGFQNFYPKAMSVHAMSFLVWRVDYQLAMAPGRAILDKFANADWELSEALCKECPREAMGGKRKWPDVECVMLASGGIQSSIFSLGHRLYASLWVNLILIEYRLHFFIG